MLILIDAGNTRLKWGVWADGSWQAKGALANDSMSALPGVLAGFAPSWIGVSCVAGPSVRAAIETCARECGIEPYWLHSGGELFGMRNLYEDPATLGTDRFAALFACHCLGLAPCVVATAGTALTVDALSAQGEFLGGVIAPGAGLMRRSLAEGTAGLANSPGVCQDFPRATADAIETGIAEAMAGPISAMRERLARHAGRPVATVLSGGDAGLLARHLGYETHVIEDAVLEGMLWLAKHLGVRDASR